MTCRSQPRSRLTLFVFAILLIAFTATVANAEWSLEEKLRQIKLLDFELVAIVDGKDVPIRTPEDFKLLPDSPPPQFKLVDLRTGKEIPIVMNKSLEWGKALWEGLCDAAGLKPHCNGFFK